jgi:pimeloyl-ACP methyl ester carboxylesterase
MQMTETVPKLQRFSPSIHFARSWPLPLKVALMTVCITVMVCLGIPILAAHLLSTPQRHPLSVDITPRTLGIEFENVRFPARGDDIGISGWFIPCGQSRKAIVFVHGKDANRTLEFDPDLDDDIPGIFTELAVSLNKKGFALLMIDLRGHGQSGQARFGFGRTERFDVLGAVDWLLLRGYRPDSIGVLGESMGAATTIGAASIDGRIQAVVANSSFAELAPLVEQSWGSVTHLPGLFLPMTNWIGRHWFGCDIDTTRPVDEIATIHRPVLLIHGDSDPVIPVEHSRKLKKAAGGFAELWECRSDKHLGSYFVDAQAYADKVALFFDRHLD